MLNKEVSPHDLYITVVCQAELSVVESFSFVFLQLFNLSVLKFIS